MTSKPAFTYAPADRAAFLEGLRELADYLATNPEVPTPYAPHILVTNSAGTDTERRAFVAHAAVALGVPLTEDGECFTTARRFGALVYQVWASTRAGEDDYAARTSYNHAVRP